MARNATPLRPIREPSWDDIRKAVGRALNMHGAEAS